MMLCEPRPLNLKPYQAKYGRNLRRYRRAIQKGNYDQVHQLEHLLLNSHSAKALAIAKAADKKKYPLYPAKLEMMAGMLSCWEEPIAPAKLYFKKKPGGDLRSLFKYTVFGAAQQYLVLWVLEPRLRLHEGQYAVPGRDWAAAIEKVKEQIRKGYEWVIRGDIKNCYPSMNGDAVLDMLPGPRAVLRQVILPPMEECITYSSHYAALLDQVRRGLPQGAASTALVAAAVLAPVLDELPDCVVIVLYVDDFAIFAPSKDAAVETMNTLREALWAAPVGNLQLKFCNIHHVAEGFGFLGYHIRGDGEGGVIARPGMTAFEKLEAQLDAVDPTLPDAHARKVARLHSWRCRYVAWDGDEIGDNSLVAILGHHFSGDLEELVRRVHLRAKKTRDKKAAALA